MPDDARIAEIRERLERCSFADLWADVFVHAPEDIPYLLDRLAEAEHRGESKLMQGIRDKYARQLEKLGRFFAPLIGKEEWERADTNMADAIITFTKKAERGEHLHLDYLGVAYPLTAEGTQSFTVAVARVAMKRAAEIAKSATGGIMMPPAEVGKQIAAAIQAEADKL